MVRRHAGSSQAQKVNDQSLTRGIGGSHTACMGSHAMPGGGRPNRTLILSQAKRPRAGASRVRLALSTARLRVSRLINPARPAELGGAMMALDATAWQRVVHTFQTPAFRLVLIVGLSFAWIGTATLSSFADGPAPNPVHGQARLPSDSAVEPRQYAGSTGNPDYASDAAPPIPAQVEVSDEFLRNYAKIAADLDRQAGRDDLGVSSQPALPLSHCPTCTDALLPGPEQSPEAPEATGAEPLAPPPTAVEAPAPQQLPTSPDQPASPPTNELPAEPLPAGPPPADTSGQAADQAG